jgi:SAM-dependent methyltransferase
MSKELRSKNHIEEDWYATAFNTLYPILYAHRTVEAARPEVDFAVEQVALQPTDTVLDLCCGNGRHMVHLEAIAARTLGLDYSADLLHIATQTVAPTSELILGDMRALPFRESLDVICNFFTSFGYFQTAQQNNLVVRDIAHALKPGGRFFLDYLNPPHVAATLVPRSEREAEGYLIVEERWIDEKGERINKHTTVSRGDEIIRESGESVQIYTLNELTSMLSANHLGIDSVYGDYDGAPLDNSQPRTILVGHKE